MKKYQTPIDVMPHILPHLCRDMNISNVAVFFDEVFRKKCEQFISSAISYRYTLFSEPIIGARVHQWFKKSKIRHIYSRIAFNRTYETNLTNEIDYLRGFGVFNYFVLAANRTVQRMLGKLI